MALLTKDQTAAKLGEKFGPMGKPFTVQTLTRWMGDAHMPHFKVGRRVMFDEVEVVRWADRRFSRNQQPVRR